uniref:Alpha/beta hydrolase fold-3 domain-containing protein n=1 Tax=Glycine max TaxID=3847 RepID=A0A0R0ICK5_SOYBN
MRLFSFPHYKSFWRSSIAFAFFLTFLTLQTQSTPIPCNKDPYKELNLIPNKNGTVTRPNKPPESPPAPDPNLNTLVLSKDISINQSKGTWARVYLPRVALDHSSKLPLLVFYHGGGFIFLGAASTIFHNFCFNMANDVVASADAAVTLEDPAGYGCGGDHLWIGVRVLGHFTPGDYHGVQDSDPLKARELYGVIKTFISALN